MSYNSYLAENKEVLKITCFLPVLLQPIQREKKRTRHIFSDSARQNAEDIFGVAFDYGEFEEYGDDADDVSEAEEDGTRTLFPYNF